MTSITKAGDKPVDPTKLRDLTPQEEAAEACYRRFMLIVGAIFTLGAILLMVLTAKAGLKTFAGSFGTYVIHAIPLVAGAILFGVGATYDAEKEKYPREIRVPDGYNIRENDKYDWEVIQIRSCINITALLNWVCRSHRHYDSFYNTTTRTKNLYELVRARAMTVEQVNAIDSIIKDCHDVPKAHNLKVKRKNEILAVYGLVSFDPNTFKQLANRPTDLQELMQIEKETGEYQQNRAKLEQRWTDLRTTLNGATGKSIVADAPTQPIQPITSEQL